MAIDPICGMTVNEATARSAERDGQTIYFCSEHCRQKFLAGTGKVGPESSSHVQAVRAGIRSFNAAAHHMLIAASGGSAVGELANEFVFAECVQDCDVSRSVARLDAEQSTVLVEPDFLAARFQKRKSADWREHGLTSRKKVELVSALLELAQADRGVLRQLTARFDVAAAPNELVAATRRAIADATDFDERDMNTNFDFDYEAYKEAKRNFTRLIASGQFRPAMQHSLELMKEGSHQVEMSDEGMMTDDIEECLNVVIQGLEKCDLPAAEIIAWCSAMLDGDRVKFIAREPLQSLRNRFGKGKGTTLPEK